MNHSSDWKIFFQSELNAKIFTTAGLLSNCTARTNTFAWFRIALFLNDSPTYINKADALFLLFASFSADGLRAQSYSRDLDFGIPRCFVFVWRRCRCLSLGSCNKHLQPRVECVCFLICELQLTVISDFVRLLRFVVNYRVGERGSKVISIVFCSNL